MNIGIVGIAGRMGRLLAEEVVAAGHVLVGGTDRPGTQAEGTMELPDLAARTEVVIDFTVAATVSHHAAVLSAAGTAWVLGTTGLSAAQETEVAVAARRIPVVYAANFSPGVTLLLELAERMAAALPGTEYDAEIMEMHHRQKVDAPSGTAVAMGRAVAAGRGVDLATHTESGRDGHTGARRPGAIGFAALRGGQVVGEHTLLFAGGSEHISLSHRALDRRVFASGAVRAAGWLEGRGPGLYGMRDVIASA